MILVARETVFEQSYEHKTVCHSAKKFVDGMAHTNGVESVWAVLKRGFYGIYHSFSTSRQNAAESTNAATE